MVGVPDDRHGEAVAAFVVPHKGVRTSGGDGVVSAGETSPGATTSGGEGEGEGEGKAQVTLGKQDVQDWVRAKLSGHLVPKYVFWIDECPKTASGKIQKYKLRDLAKQLLSSSPS